MYYEINISLNGEHFFATAERSIKSENKLENIYKILKDKFPTEEGYNITVTKWETVGRPINVKGEF